jgi:hypothetical protein
MISDHLGLIDPADFPGFALGRATDELLSGMLILNLSEFGWIRRHGRRGQPPPPVLVWLPGPAPISPTEATLFDLRPLTLRFPH